MSEDINVLALVFGGEKFIFFYEDQFASDTIEKIAEYAENPDLDSFCWNCAGVLVKKIRGSFIEIGKPDPLRYVNPILRNKLEEAVEEVEGLLAIGINPITKKPYESDFSKGRFY